jgi:hypothetical protein
MMRRSELLLLLLLALAAGVGPVSAGGKAVALSPSQNAYLTAEQRRIEDYYVTRVARIAGVGESQVRAALPDEKRITATVARLLEVLEKHLGHPLSEGQRAEIMAVDAERRESLARVRAGASQR